MRDARMEFYQTSSGRRNLVIIDYFRESDAHHQDEKMRAPSRAKCHVFLFYAFLSRLATANGA